MDLKYTSKGSLSFNLYLGNFSPNSSKWMSWKLYVGNTDKLRHYSKNIFILQRKFSLSFILSLIHLRMEFRKQALSGSVIKMPDLLRLDRSIQKVHIPYDSQRWLINYLTKLHWLKKLGCLYRSFALCILLTNFPHYKNSFYFSPSAIKRYKILLLFYAICHYENSFIVILLIIRNVSVASGFEACYNAQDGHNVVDLCEEQIHGWENVSCSGKFYTQPPTHSAKL